MNIQGRIRSQAALGITLAVCVGTPAWAQSNVTVSGYLDIGVFRSTTDQWIVGTIKRSNLAFSGAEDLGGGLSATFKLSTRFDLNTGQSEVVATKPFFHAESTVGLKGGFGTLRMGRALDAMYGSDWAFDAWNYFDRLTSPGWDLWHWNFPSDPHANSGKPDYGRLNNGIFYDSPTFNGFTFHLSGSPEKVAGDTNTPLGGSIAYAGELFQALYANERNSVGNTDSEYALKGTFAGLTLMGVYDVSKAGASTAKTTTLGARYSIGATTLLAGWGKANVDGIRKEQVTSVGVSYALSKRTAFYADFAHKQYVANSANTYGVGMSHGF
ncbi:MAG: porin [Burkholderiales bacterium]|nr:porin [Burkholderiales bacterium]MDE1925602.1 porin [Burkholderiales bacterium]MDE2158512.1 porin [Burkholderiales bacterium]